VINLDDKKHRLVILIFFLFTIHYYFFFTDYCSAKEETIITSETLEYFEDTSTFFANGSVKAISGDKVIESDEMTYNVQTSDVVATGNARYNDAEVAITANKIELNLDGETGRLYEAEIFFKKDNYHISGKDIEKKGENHYFAPEATFSTCDAPVPAWSFKGKDADLLVGERLKAKNTFFYIKDVPALYAPYFFFPFQTERKTGFLMPVADFSSSRGIHLRMPFFWAISENMDATAIMDLYTKKGIGEGLQYRYIEPGDLKGNWWLYHIRDTDLNKDLFEVRALHEQRSQEGIGGFLSINFVNEKDFYREFSPYLEVRTRRFLESSGEISLQLENSRAYLLSQYWVSLEEEIRPPPQRLPEVGYVFNPTKVGPLWFSGMATVSNFWRDENVMGQRLDIYPRILYEFGNEIVLTQALGFRETAYSLHRSEENSLHREAIEYSAIAHTSLLKRYGSLTHVLEPSIGYTLITDSEDLPLFDSTEFFKKTSTIELSLINRFFNREKEILIVKASQAYDANFGDRSFLPFRLEVAIKRPVSIRIDTAYNVHEGKLESINSDMHFRISQGAIWVGQRYNRLEDVRFYKAGFELNPYKPWNIRGRIWYDADMKEVRDVSIDLKYLSQCWSVNMEFIKRTHDFTFSVMFELKGISKALKI
jgi:LPS-assembly protein